MRKEEIYNYIKNRTLGKFADGVQVKVTAVEIKKTLTSINEKTVYANLKRLESEIKSDRVLNRLFVAGKRYVFPMKRFWVEEEK